MIIQHNIQAINALRHTQTNNRGIAKNLEELSSGYKINRADDDAAGLAVSEKMRQQIRGLGMAERNVAHGVSLIQTGEGALHEIHSILHRMEELSVQSANGTYVNEDRGQLEKEFQTLKSEINRIAESTHYNGIHMLNGTEIVDSGIKGTDDAGSTNGIGDTGDISVGGSEPIIITDAEEARIALGWPPLHSYNFLPDGNNGHSVFDIFGTTPYGIRIQVTFERGSDGIWTVSLDGDVSSNGNVPLNERAHLNLSPFFYRDDGTFIAFFYNPDFYNDYLSTVAEPDIESGKLVFEYIHGFDGDMYGLSSSGDYTLISGEVVFKDDGKTGGEVGGGNGGEVGGETGDKPGSKPVIKPPANDDSIILQIGADNSDLQRVAISRFDLRCTNLGEANARLSGATITTRESANEAISIIRTASNQVSEIRAYYGAAQNRLEHALKSLGVSKENLTAAESVIRDADMAKKMMEYTKNNILLQASQSMLAQANSLPQGALQLLR